MSDPAFPRSIHQFEAFRGEFMENLTSDCNMLKELLQVSAARASNDLSSLYKWSIQSIIIIQERGSTTAFSSTANLFENANGARIQGGNITNIAGSSNSVIVIGPYELGVGVLVFLLVACLFFCPL